MPGLQVRAGAAPDGRRSLLDVLQFLADRGVSPEVIGLAMSRAGIPVEVSRVLAEFVVTSQPALAPPAQARRHEVDTGRAAEMFIRKATTTAMTVVLFLGAGLGVGFAVGMEIGLAQGLEQGIEHGVAQIQRLVLR